MITTLLIMNQLTVLKIDHFIYLIIFKELLLDSTAVSNGTVQGDAHCRRIVQILISITILAAIKKN